jgi:hypothetical protein
MLWHVTPRGPASSHRWRQEARLDQVVWRRAIDKVKRATAVVAAFGLATPAGRRGLGPAGRYPLHHDSERIAASTAAVVGLIALVIGGALFLSVGVSATTGGRGDRDPDAWPLGLVIVRSVGPLRTVVLARGIG